MDLLAAEYDLDTAALRRSARNRDPGEKFFRHARLRTNARFAFTIAMAAREDVEIAFWYKDGSIKIPITYTTDDGTVVEDTIIPDDFLGIRWTKSGIVEALFGESDRRKDYPTGEEEICGLCASLTADEKWYREAPIGTPACAASAACCRAGAIPTAGVYPRRPTHNEFSRAVDRQGSQNAKRACAGSPVDWTAHKVKRLDCSGLRMRRNILTQPERILESVWQKARNDTWRPLLD